jgi:PAS domain S-box-containing protein
MNKGIYTEETILRLIAEYTNDLITLFRNDIMEFISPSVKRILGYTQEEFLALNHLDLIHPEDIGSVRAMIDYRIQNKITGAHTYVYRQRHKNGEYRWLETVEAYKEINKEGIITILNSRDITERIQIENNLKEAILELHFKDEFLEAVTDSSPVLMYLYDTVNNRNVWVNRKNHIGLLPQEQILGYIHPEDLFKVEERLNRLKENRSARRQSVEYRMKTSEHDIWRWFHDTGIVFKRRGDGRVEQILCSSIDVTEQKRKI